MTGLLAWGEMMLLGTIISSFISALVSCVWATCMFISSPSKSALYGEVTDRFNLHEHRKELDPLENVRNRVKHLSTLSHLNVEKGKIFTR